MDGIECTRRYREYEKGNDYTSPHHSPHRVDLLHVIELN